MIKVLLAGAAAALLTTSAAAAAPAPAAWVVQPGAEDCRTELELAGASGATVSAALVSDGERVELTPTATVKGTLVAPSVVLREGATFNGKIQVEKKGSANRKTA